MTKIRVVLPYHLKNLARVESEVEVEAETTSEGAVSLGAVLDAIEKKYPMLRGTFRDHVTGKRRDFVRFFAAETDFSHEPPTVLLPAAIAEGKEAFIVLGAIAGG